MSGSAHCRFQAPLTTGSVRYRATVVAFEPQAQSGFRCDRPLLRVGGLPCGAAPETRHRHRAHLEALFVLAKARDEPAVFEPLLRNLGRLATL